MDDQLTKIIIISLFVIFALFSPSSKSASLKNNKKPDNQTKKLIVFWNKPWKEFPPWDPALCSETGDFDCEIKYGRSPGLIKQADSVIIHPVFTSLESNGSNFLKAHMLDLVNSVRTSSQVYVFAQWESPEFHRGDYRYLNGFFNKTMTYIPESDYWFPYGSIGLVKLRALLDEQVVKKLGSARFSKQEFYRKATFDANFKELDFPEKIYPVAAVVSHCRSKYRNELILKIQEEIGVENLDLYGDCFKSQKKSRAENLTKTYLESDKNLKKLEFGKYNSLYHLLKNYKFYLAFENSRCDHYITEKIFDNSVLTRAVPIVAGPSRAHYEKLVPSSSFIHVDDFESVEKLGIHVKYLLGNETAYMKYFDWHSDFDLKKTKTVELSTVEEFRNSGICKLCKDLFGTGDHSVVEDVHSFWYGQKRDRCTPVRDRPGSKFSF